MAESTPEKFRQGRQKFPPTHAHCDGLATPGAPVCDRLWPSDVFSGRKHASHPPVKSPVSSFPAQARRTIENSPQFQLWVGRNNTGQVPLGTAEVSGSLFRDLNCLGSSSRNLPAEMARRGPGGRAPASQFRIFRGFNSLVFFAPFCGTLPRFHFPAFPLSALAQPLTPSH